MSDLSQKIIDLRLLLSTSLRGAGFATKQSSPMSCSAAAKRKIASHTSPGGRCQGKPLAMTDGPSSKDLAQNTFLIFAAHLAFSPVTIPALLDLNAHHPETYAAGNAQIFAATHAAAGEGLRHN